MGECLTTIQISSLAFSFAKSAMPFDTWYPYPTRVCRPILLSPVQELFSCETTRLARRYDSRLPLAMYSVTIHGRPIIKKKKKKEKKKRQSGTKHSQPDETCSLVRGEKSPKKIWRCCAKNIVSSNLFSAHSLSFSFSLPLSRSLSLYLYLSLSISISLPLSLSPLSLSLSPLSLSLSLSLRSWSQCEIVESTSERFTTVSVWWLS